MKPRTVVATLVIRGLVWLLLCSSGASHAQQHTWKVTSLEWEPYSSSSMNNGGNAIQRLRNILAQCNIRLQVEFYPWRRAKEIAGRSDYLGYFPAWPDGVRTDFVASEPVVRTGKLRRLDNPPPNSPELSKSIQHPRAVRYRAASHKRRTNS